MFSNPNQLVNTIFGIKAVESLTPDRSESRGKKSLHIVTGIGRSPCVEPCYHIHINAASATTILSARYFTAEQQKAYRRVENFGRLRAVKNMMMMMVVSV